MTRPDTRTAQHAHKWTWHHDWWGAHVCECGAVRESPPIDPAAEPALDVEGEEE